MFDEKLPQEVNAEKSVLSSVILFRDDRKKAFELLSTDDFYSTANQIIFQKCKDFSGNGAVIETADIYSALNKDEKKYVKAGYLGALTDSEPASVNIKNDIKKLKAAAKKRRTIELCTAIAKTAFKSDSEKTEELTQRLILETKSEEEPQEQKDNNLAFPYKVMTGAAGYFANCYGQVLEVPQTFLFFGYLTLLGSVLSSRLTLKSELNTQPRLYTILVGESALDRKSTALHKIDEHFKKVVHNFSSCWGINSAEGLQKILKKEQDGNHTGITLIFDELKSFVSKCKIDSSILLPCVNTLFESNRYHSHTKKKSLEIEDAHLSFIGASTLQTYERIYTDAFVDIGFPNRVFLVIGTGKRQFSIPEKISDEDIKEMESNLVKVLSHVGTGLELDIEPHARQFYHDWYMNMEHSSHARRLDTYSLRLMMLLAVNSLKNTIDLETTQHATALCDWQLLIRKIHDPIQADDKYAKMEITIRRQLKQGDLADRDLKVRTHAYRAGLHIFDSALKNLRTHKEVAWNKLKKRWSYVGK